MVQPKLQPKKLHLTVAPEAHGGYEDLKSKRLVIGECVSTVREAVGTMSDVVVTQPEGGCCIEVSSSAYDTLHPEVAEAIRKSLASNKPGRLRIKQIFT